MKFHEAALGAFDRYQRELCCAAQMAQVAQNGK